MYSGVEAGFEQQTLPWPETGSVEAGAVERRAGYLARPVHGHRPEREAPAGTGTR
ncbi:hypothetical protein GCM10010347_52650 [Streptomyces cirratus]|uniref:Uncharacterized protein n=1 Tax=Streptomyces cirratus TaxID=68187 RepID=A0ABQ3EZ19_9ACTN|nr:hypothetical protein [Streptomyces cirratus]GHB75687.1 hypothetical protein GCM10010347_52650 [Streptomyces cirratus]